MSSARVSEFGSSIVVAKMHGSLPMGGVREDAPIYALEQLPKSLSFNTGAITNQNKQDIGLKDAIAFTVDNVVTEDEADTLIALTEMLGYRDDAPGIRTPPGMRQNKTVHWVSNEQLLKAIFTRISPHLPKEIDDKELSSRLSQRINFYKYEAGDVFNRHVDGGWPGYGLNHDGTSMVQWSGVHSKLTMLLYLNGKEEGIEGGETMLFGKHGDIAEVKPKKGLALFFRHGSSIDSIMHEGTEVKGATPKYVARINIMYKSV